jgi:hypothetical protein
MLKACGRNGRNDKCLQNLVGKFEGRDEFG